MDGLTAGDFTLLDNGKPQSIAFFGSERTPVSLAVLLDVSPSMEASGKLKQAQALLAPLLRGKHPDDQIFLAPFTDRVESFTELSAEQRAQPPRTRVNSEGRGTALYDALASALCHLRGAPNVRQAIIVITDGADQHSRLSLDQLVTLTQSSSAQIFTVGLFAPPEYDALHDGGMTVTLLGEREIDNPMVVFDRLAKESGAESFFPRSNEDLRKAMDRIATVLQAQYTLSYYVSQSARFRRIEVRVSQRGLRVLTRRRVGAEVPNGQVHFASSCLVAPQDHPYPWEASTAQRDFGLLSYTEDFLNPSTGWPNRDGMRYIARGYEISRPATSNGVRIGPTVDGTVVSYGPTWTDFRGAVTIQTDWTRSPPAAARAGLVFGLSETGYYAVLLSGSGAAHALSVRFEVIKKSLPDGKISTLIPSTDVSASHGWPHRLTVEHAKGHIDILVDDRQVVPALSLVDDALDSGLIGFAFFGDGRAVFRNLLVQGLQ